MPTRLDSLDRALSILCSFTKERPEWGVSELARHLKLHKSRVHRALKVLERRGFILKNHINSKYRLGLKLLELAAVLEERFDLKVVARPYLAELSKKINATVLLRVKDGLDSLVIESVESQSPLRMVRPVGSRIPCYCGAPGKVHLAFLPQDELEEALGKIDLVKFTDKSITDKERFLKELRRVRRYGYAFSDEEAIRGVRSVAVPIIDGTGRVVAVISIGMPKEELPLKRVPEVVRLAKEAASQISERLKGGPVEGAGAVR